MEAFFSEKLVSKTREPIFFSEIHPAHFVSITSAYLQEAAAKVAAEPLPPQGHTLSWGVGSAWGLASKEQNTAKGGDIPVVQVIQARDFRLVPSPSPLLFLARPDEASCPGVRCPQEGPTWQALWAVSCPQPGGTWGPQPNSHRHSAPSAIPPGAWKQTLPTAPRAAYSLRRDPDSG